jgi:tRNA(Arg) A34 adenosine deaminase TadA
MIKTAIQAARENTVGRPLPKLAAVLTDGHNTVVGFNSYKTHPLQLRFNAHNPKAICLHAEMDAIRQAVRLSGSDLSDYKMYVARVKRDGQSPVLSPVEGAHRQS